MACKCESVHRAGGEAASGCKLTVVSEEGREKLVAGDPRPVGGATKMEHPRRDERGTEVIDWKRVVRRPSRGLNSPRRAPSIS